MERGARDEQHAGSQQPMAGDAHLRLAAQFAQIVGDGERRLVGGAGLRLDRHLRHRGSAFLAGAGVPPAQFDGRQAEFPAFAHHVGDRVVAGAADDGAAPVA
ncbi:hypothetical protein D3C76_1414140 [compost metagenome]